VKFFHGFSSSRADSEAGIDAAPLYHGAAGASKGIVPMAGAAVSRSARSGSALLIARGGGALVLHGAAAVSSRFAFSVRSASARRLRRWRHAWTADRRSGRLTSACLAAGRRRRRQFTDGRSAGAGATKQQEPAARKIRAGRPSLPKRSELPVRHEENPKHPFAR